jgi:hypothetical protein
MSDIRFPQQKPLSFSTPSPVVLVGMRAAGVASAIKRRLTKPDKAKNLR